MQDEFKIVVEVNGPRPAFYKLSELVWGPGHNYDSDGDSNSSDDTEWLYAYARDRDEPEDKADYYIIEVEHDLTSREDRHKYPLKFVVTSNNSKIANRVAENLANATNGQIIGSQK